MADDRCKGVGGGTTTMLLPNWVGLELEGFSRVVLVRLGEHRGGLTPLAMGSAMREHGDCEPMTGVGRLEVGNGFGASRWNS